ncbi:MAG: stress response translation initiation inhibitor YciH [Candidatus Woesearchaeota archaeon]
MTEVCPNCGLPKDLCVCEAIAKETQKIEVRLEKKKFGKNCTVIDGLDPKEIDVKELAKKLKAKFACGGTVKDNKIELQGDHRSKVREALVTFGFPHESIVVK